MEGDSKQSERRKPPSPRGMKKWKAYTKVFHPKAHKAMSKAVGVILQRSESRYLYSVKEATEVVDGEIQSPANGRSGEYDGRWDCSGDLTESEEGPAGGRGQSREEFVLDSTGALLSDFSEQRDNSLKALSGACSSSLERFTLKGIHSKGSPIRRLKTNTERSLRRCLTGIRSTGSRLDMSRTHSELGSQSNIDIDNSADKKNDGESIRHLEATPDDEQPPQHTTRRAIPQEVYVLDGETPSCRSFTTGDNDVNDSPQNPKVSRSELHDPRFQLSDNVNPESTKRIEDAISVKSIQTINVAPRLKGDANAGSERTESQMRQGSVPPTRSPSLPILSLDRTSTGKSVATAMTRHVKERLESIVNPRTRSSTILNPYFSMSESQAMLIDSYSCAWSKELMITGRLYITTCWLLFFSKLLGRNLRVVIPVPEIKKVRRNGTFIFPTSLEVTTKNSSYQFTSFVKRDECLLKLWEVVLASREYVDRFLGLREDALYQLYSYGEKCFNLEPGSLQEHSGSYPRNKISSLQHKNPTTGCSYGIGVSDWPKYSNSSRSLHSKSPKEYPPPQSSISHLPCGEAFNTNEHSERRVDQARSYFSAAVPGSRRFPTASPSYANLLTLMLLLSIGILFSTNRILLNKLYDLEILLSTSADGSVSQLGEFIA